MSEKCMRFYIKMASPYSPILQQQGEAVFEKLVCSLFFAEKVAAYRR